MKKAMFQKKMDDRLVCQLCPHSCVLADGETGKCKVRKNIAGELKSLSWGKLVATHIDPIEKKPLFHFHPGSAVYSIATPGCNLSCSFCQNWSLSQDISLPEDEVEPKHIVEMAIKSGAAGLAYTYSEPTVFYEYALDTARLAKKAGLFNVWISNGMINPKPIKRLAKVIDATNIDIKAFSDRFYKRVCGGTGLEPILSSIKEFHKQGVWIELTNLLIPGLNDASSELESMVAWIAELDTNIPLHISRFHPDNKMIDRPATSNTALETAYRIAKAKLNYVYIGNLPGHQAESTFCPSCESLLIGRRGFAMISNKLKNGRCPQCDTAIAGTMS
ncbi:MAG: AmmeMemoRadiSam system radical SAM enzyme [Candidatus Altiarchaeota archaeon]|nr:AmmeMemoRadiSam system radical SAM enzyme [Candidatus Altiarchaeota archaeon]